jgi:hypothetical protein
MEQSLVVLPLPVKFIRFISNNRTATSSLGHLEMTILGLASGAMDRRRLRYSTARFRLVRSLCSIPQPSTHRILATSILMKRDVEKTNFGRRFEQ